MKLKQVVPWVIVMIAIVYGLSVWLNKPYSSVQFLDANTFKGRQHLFVYTLSKVFAQRKKLTGNDPYKLYLFANDPDGIKTLKFFVNGKEVKTPFKPGETFEEEYKGMIEYGLHKYKMIVIDEEGSQSIAEALIHVAPPAGASI
ncbi:MAG: hypothetical protein P9L94_15050 [Candidatus Hinthialibacter antarcticus]|nr:hypothetical protein [Candidatus Hinthialibacter antarcticus]